MSQFLFAIKSKYNLKSIFSIVDYERLLKLIKINKKLQKSLEINVKNYRERSDYQYIVGNKREYPEFGFDLKLFLGNCFMIIMALIIFIFVLIYSSLLASKGAFNENNTKDNYNKNYAKIIDKINWSLFGFLAYIIISYILVITLIRNDDEYDIVINKVIKRVSLVMIDFLYIVYEIIIIFKLYLSYKIKKNKNLVHEMRLCINYFYFFIFNCSNIYDD